MKIELTNDFHETSITLRAAHGKLSLRQVRRAKRALCGHAACICGDALGTRGAQPVEIEMLYDRGILIGAEVRAISRDMGLYWSEQDERAALNEQHAQMTGQS